VNGLETALSFLTGVLRYVLPVLAVIILFTCIISLFRNRPRLHKLAQLVDQNNGSIIDIDRWETSIGKSKSNAVSKWETDQTTPDFDKIIPICNLYNVTTAELFGEEKENDYSYNIDSNTEQISGVSDFFSSSNFGFAIAPKTISIVATAIITKNKTMQSLKSGINIKSDLPCF